MSFIMPVAPPLTVPLEAMSFTMLDSSVADSESLVGLGERVFQAFTKMSAQSEGGRAELLDALNQPGNIGNPSALSMKMEQLGDLDLEVKFVNALVRRGTTAIETLLKS